MSDQKQQFPQRLFGVSSVYKHQEEMVSSEISPLNVYQNAHSFLKAPFHSANQSVSSTKPMDPDFRGEIGLRALRDNDNYVLWDVESGDVLNIEILSQNFVDDTFYNGKVDVVDKNTRSDEMWQILENGVETEDNCFDFGAVALSQTPRIFEDGKYDFFIESIERANHYSGPAERIRSVFDHHAPDIEAAIEMLEKDPERLSYGRI